MQPSQSSCAGTESLRDSPACTPPATRPFLRFTIEHLPTNARLGTALSAIAFVALAFLVACGGGAGAPTDGSIVDSGDAVDAEPSTDPDGGVETSAVIGSAGGELSIPGARLVVPPGALSEDVTITIRESNEPVGLIHLSPVFRFEPAGTTFTTPVTLEIDYDEEEATLGTPTLYYTVAGIDDLFAPVEEAVIADGVATVSVSHFSGCLVAYPPPGPALSPCPATTLEFDSVPSTICSNSWTESGVTISVTPTTASCCDAIQSMGTALCGYCYVLNLDLTSLGCGVSDIELDLSFCGGEHPLADITFTDSAGAPAGTAQIDGFVGTSPFTASTSGNTLAENIDLVMAGRLERIILNP